MGCHCSPGSECRVRNAYPVSTTAVRTDKDNLKHLTSDSRTLYVVECSVFNQTQHNLLLVQKYNGVATRNKDFFLLFLIFSYHHSSVWKHQCITGHIVKMLDFKIKNVELLTCILYKKYEGMFCLD